MDVRTVLFALLRSVVCGGGLKEDIVDACTTEMLEELYVLTAKHDLAHLAGHALGNLELTDSEALKKLKQMAFSAVYRHARMDAELKRICMVLEEQRIPFVLLKGAVLRKFYPEPWMRTSCDIDILVREEMIDSVVALLKEKMNYRKEGETPRDISLYSENGVHLELHRNVISEADGEKEQRVLSAVWKNTFAAENNSCCFEISDEFFYYYHLAHMARHIKSGGCGVRHFLDLWILNHCVQSDREKRERLLIEGGLLPFALAAEKLSEAWFSNKPMDSASEKLEDYILCAGVYGTMENRVIVSRGKSGGKWRYAVSRVFLPYHSLKHLYPVLKKHKHLAPLFQIVRWIRILATGRTQYAVNELRTNAKKSNQRELAIQELLGYLGL